MLAVGAHPDDVELSMGGAIASLVDAGHHVTLVDLTDGEPTPFGDRATRLAEASRAAAVLGIHERRTLGQQNRHVRDTDDARAELAEVLRELRPDLLFLPHAIDAHPDHVAASSLGDAARFWAKLVKTHLRHEPHYPARVLYCRPLHARVVLVPALVLDVTATHARKMSALGEYASQFALNPANARALTNVATHDAHHGSLIRVAFGEPFFSSDVLGLRSLTDLT